MKPTREEVLENALQKIARWHDEFPPTGQTWHNGMTMSYGAAYGSNGERDYMRQVALDALAAKPDSVNLAKPLAESAVAPGECGSVPDEQIAWNVWNDCHYVVRQSADIKQATWSLTLQREQIVRRAQSKAGMQPPNQPNSDHVAVISAKPDSVHLAEPTETSADPRLGAVFTKAQLIRAFNSGYMLGHHDTVEGIFSDIHWSDMKTYNEDYVDDLIADDALPPAQSGVSSPKTEVVPNEKTFADKTGTFADTSNCFVVQTEQPSHIQIAMAVRDACLVVSANFKSGGMSAVEALFKSRGEMSALDLRGIISSIAPAEAEQPSLSDARKSFEWWAINNQPWLLERSTDDAHKLLILTAWEAWQAAISAQRQDSDKDAS